MSEIRVLVTGGSRGIGRAIALRFAKEGAKVVVAARNSEQLDAVVQEINAAGGQGHAAQMNVQDHGSVEAAVWRATEFTGGPLDVIVNNAGIFAQAALEDQDIAEWDRMIAINLTGPFWVMSEAIHALEEGEKKHVFNISSIAGKQGFPKNAAYSASKYGLRGFSDALREELRDKGIRVTTVYPTATDTTIFDGVPGDWDRSTMLKPEDVAEAVWRAYASPESEDVADVDVAPAG